MTDDLKCFIQGCDFAVESDEHWHEHLEQHVRWIHVARNDFGESPIPSLFSLLANGLIRSDEFAFFTRDVIQKEMDAIAPPPSPRRVKMGIRYFLTGSAASVVGLLTIFVVNIHADDSIPWSLLFSLASVCFATSFFSLLFTFRLLYRDPKVVRLGLYPDTTVDSDDDEGDEG